MPDLTSTDKVRIQQEIHSLLSENCEMTAGELYDAVQHLGIEISKMQVKNIAKNLRKDLPPAEAADAAKPKLKGLGSRENFPLASERSSNGEGQSAYNFVQNLFTVRDSEGKGKCCFADRDIKKGELVLRERPIAIAPRSGQTLEVAERAFSELGQEEQDAVMSLHDNDTSSGSTKTMSGIFKTNAMEIGGRGGNVNHAALFLTGSRLNHSCRPNISHAFHESVGEIFMWAIADIKQGEELCITYLDSRKMDTWETRRRVLEKDYGFICACEVCADKSGHWDVLFAQISIIERAIQGPDVADPAEFLKQIDQLIQLYTEVQLCGPITMSRLAAEGFECGACISRYGAIERPQMTEYAKMCYENRVMAYGKDDAETHEAKWWYESCQKEKSYNECCNRIFQEQAA